MTVVGFFGAKPRDFTMTALGASMTDTNQTAKDGADTLAAEKTALAWTHTARFLTTASQLDQLPQTELPEIAFVGRSNAGKSVASPTFPKATQTLRRNPRRLIRLIGDWRNISRNSSSVRDK